VTTVVVDTNVMVGWLDPRDVQSPAAVALMATIAECGGSTVLLDCVVVEVVGVFCRRWAERKATDPLPDFASMFPRTSVAVGYRLLETRWEGVLGEVHSSGGALNAHDALILTFCRASGIRYLATLDRGLRGRGLEVLSTPDEVRSALVSAAP
jgi:predicted nucleic acid-binding protein